MRDIPVTFGPLTFPLITISSNPRFTGSDNEELDAEVKSFISIHQSDKNPEQFFSELRVQLEKRDDGSLPYAFNIQCFLPLTVDSDVPTEQRKEIALKAAHSLAFPAARELIISLTARQPHGQFSIGLGRLLPSPEVLSPEKTRPQKLTKKGKAKAG